MIAKEKLALTGVSCIRSLFSLHKIVWNDFNSL